MLKVKMSGTDCSNNSYTSIKDESSKLSISSDNNIKSFCDIPDTIDEYTNSQILTIDNLSIVDTSKKHINTTKELENMVSIVENEVAVSGNVEQIVINFNTNRPSVLSNINTDNEFKTIHHPLYSNMVTSLQHELINDITIFETGVIGTKIDTINELSPKYTNLSNIYNGAIYDHFPDNILYRTQPTYLGATEYTPNHYYDIWRSVNFFEIMDDNKNSFVDFDIVNTIENSSIDAYTYIFNTKGMPVGDGDDDIPHRLSGYRNNHNIGSNTYHNKTSGFYKLTNGLYQMSYNIDSKFVDNHGVYYHYPGPNYISFHSTLGSIVCGYVLYKRLKTADEDDEWVNASYNNNDNLSDQWRSIFLDTTKYRNDREYNTSVNFTSDDDFLNFKDEPIIGNLNNKMLIEIPDDNYNYVIHPLLSNIIFCNTSGYNIYGIPTHTATTHGWDGITDSFVFNSKGQIRIRKLT